MAEAIGLAASIIAVAQLAGKTFQVSYNYFGSVKTAPQEIRELLDELSSLKIVLESLQKVADGNPQSEALRQLNKSSGPIERIDGILKNLYKKLASKDGSKMIDRMKWPLKEKETEKSITMIGRHTTIFNIALSADHM
ncbi:hypothetical protein DFP73DRAFT_483664 [Morchella snyderi]|nr:hypothetical protein DFP73DRAFT_483664 [Morchella snyderi]